MRQEHNQELFFEHELIKRWAWNGVMLLVLILIMGVIDYV